MDTNSAERPFLSPLRNKIILAFLLAISALVLAATTTYLSFDSLLSKVDELSAPNEKLIRLNRFFEKITQVDHQQRAEVIRNPSKPYRTFINESKTLIQQVDSLIQFTWTHQRQVQRLESMKQILTRRDYLLMEYLRLRSLLYHNKTDQVQLDSLALFLLSSKPPVDSTLTTSETNVTTTIFQAQPEEKKNFFSRLFSNKKKESENETPIAEMKSEHTIKVDTLAITRTDTTLQEIGRIMKMLGKTQQAKSKQLLQRELELINSNMILINQLLSILQEVENEEIEATRQNNTEAVNLVKSSSQNIGLIITVFFLAAAVLIFLILVDISNSNHYRLQLIEAKKEAERLGSVKQRFLANMSHEIRTPLQSIVGYSQQLLPSANNYSVQAIRKASNHLLQLVNEILDYSRLELGTITLQRIPFDLREVLSEVTDSIHILATQKNLVFDYQEEVTSDRWLLGDPFRLKQLLYNLLGNAIKFTEKGKISLRVQTERDLYTTCTFIIHDTGIGMSSEEQARIFTEFEQANAGVHEKFGGSGLGLTLVKKITDLLKGTISVTSEAGMGSTFTLELKFERAQPQITEVRSYAVAKNAQAATRVVVIDDDVLILNLCKLILSKNKIDFVALNKAEEALVFDYRLFTTVFIDIRMPGVNGYQVVTAIKKKYPHLKLIAFTAHALPDEQQNLLSVGFNAILLKPFMEADFMKFIFNTESGSGKTSITYSLQELRAMVEDESALRAILQEYCVETQADVQEARLALKENEIQTLRETIHKLASRTGQMGSHALASSLRFLETRIQQGEQLDKISKDADQLLRELEKFMEALPGQLQPG